MTLEDEHESEQNSQFRVVWHTPLTVDPVQAFEELSKGSSLSSWGSRPESDPGGVDASSTSLAKREC